ncbi:MAG: universal stress protein [Rhodoferax sp.]|nr:universal stress protein [Rhodoferax sp.]
MKILLPVDGSEMSLKAVRFAIELTRKGLQADMVLANVQDPVSLYEMVMAPDPQVLENVSEGAGAYLLKGAEALLKQAGVVYECEVASGDPGHTIIDIVERFGCDMVLMGSHGKGSLRSALLGSVSQAVLHAARVPVLIVKPDEDATT